MGKGRVLRKREYEGGCICVASRALHAFRLALSTSARRKLGASGHDKAAFHTVPRSLAGCFECL